MKKGRVLVTGATGKLGRQICLELGNHGWELVLASRNLVRAQQLADELAEKGLSTHTVALDFSVAGSAEVVVEELASRGLLLTHLVNNARSIDNLAIGRDNITSTESFRAELEIDVIQPYRLTSALACHAKHSLSAVVNIGSQYGLVAPHRSLYGGTLDDSPVQYGTAKAALHHLTRELAVRLAPKVRVNCVAFGGFQGRAPEDFVARYAALVPSRRMLSETEAAGPVIFLLDEASSSVNGHILVADGGWSIW